MAGRRSHDLPIFQDDLTFRDRHDSRFRGLQQQLHDDLSRAGFSSGWSNWNWGDQLDRICGDVFNLRPKTSGLGGMVESGGSPLYRTRGESGSRDSLDDVGRTKSLIMENPESKSRLFRTCFDVKDYEPEDIAVKVDGDSLVVEARHEVNKDGACNIKEFNRRVHIPPDVDPDKLSSTLSTDGVLTIEAPVPPKYQSVAYTSQDSVGRGSPLSQPAYGSQLSQTSNQPLASPQGAPTPKPQQQIPLDTPVYVNTPSGRVMDLVLDIGKPYCPDDLVVKLEDKTLTIEAEHVEKGTGKSGKCSMSRCFDIEETLDPGSIDAMLRTDGRLCITAKVINGQQQN